MSRAYKEGRAEDIKKWLIIWRQRYPKTSFQFRSACVELTQNGISALNMMGFRKFRVIKMVSRHRGTSKTNSLDPPRRFPTKQCIRAVFWKHYHHQPSITRFDVLERHNNITGPGTRTRSGGQKCVRTSLTRLTQMIVAVLTQPAASFHNSCRACLWVIIHRLESIS